MAGIDQQDVFSTAQALTGNAISSNVVDLGNAYTRHGVGPRPLYLVVHVTTAFSGANSTTDVRYSTSPYVGINSSITNTTICTLAANQAVGQVGAFLLPTVPGDNQFAALNYVVAGSNNTTAGVTAYVTPDPDLYSAKVKNWTGPSTS